MRYVSLLPMLLLTACPATIPMPPSPNACAWLPQLTFSTKDTPDTKREIIAYEKARQGNCK